MIRIICFGLLLFIVSITPPLFAIRVQVPKPALAVDGYISYRDLSDEEVGIISRYYSVPGRMGDPLRELDLVDCHIGPRAMVGLGHLLNARIPSLRRLVFDSTNLSAPQARTLLDGIRNNPQLISLHFRNSSFPEEALEDFAIFLQSHPLPSVELIELTDTHIPLNFLPRLKQAIMADRFLQELYLPDCGIPDNHWQSFREELLRDLPAERNFRLSR